MISALCFSTAKFAFDIFFFNWLFTRGVMSKKIYISYLYNKIPKKEHLQNWLPFRIIKICFALCTYTIIVIRYLTFDVLLRNLGIVSNMRIIFIYPSISTCSEQNIDWLNTFHLHSFPLEPGHSYERFSPFRETMH